MSILFLQSTRQPKGVTKPRAINRALKKHGGILEERLTGWQGPLMIKRVQFCDGTWGIIHTDPDPGFGLQEEDVSNASFEPPQEEEVSLETVPAEPEDGGEVAGDAIHDTIPPGKIIEFTSKTPRGQKIADREDHLHSQKGTASSVLDANKKQSWLPSLLHRRKHKETVSEVQ